jgi:hypothetical protein
MPTGASTGKKCKHGTGDKYSAPAMIFFTLLQIAQRYFRSANGNFDAKILHGYFLWPFHCSFIHHP